MDLAKMAMVMLNKGSYGDKEFYSPATFEQMMPQKLTKVLGAKAESEGPDGIGIEFMGIATENGLGKNVFGHGAASSATRRISSAPPVTATPSPTASSTPSATT